MSLADLVTLPPGGVESLPKARIVELLGEARRRTLALVEPLCDEQIDRQYSPLMSPLAWDLGHIAAFADLWVARAAGTDALRSDLFEVYDAAETPRRRRGDLPYLRCEEALAYGRAVEARALEVLDEVDISPGGDRLNAHAFVWQMLIEHEHQHNETMLQAMQLAGEDISAPVTQAASPAADRASGDGTGSETVLVEAGSALIGAGEPGFAYDNERPLHEVHVDSFELDRTPVSNGAYLAWIEEGGYRRREWWSPEGWAWREREGVERPLFWTAEGGVRRFDRTEALAPDEPVTHVSWYEADAFARARGRRLPTEAEWEKAATCDRGARRKRRFPWGDEPPRPERANLDLAGVGGDAGLARARGRRLPTEAEWEKAATCDRGARRKRRFPWGDEPPRPERANLDLAGVGADAALARPGGASPYGALAMVGDVWEWTASEFAAYPGFRAFPYREYSELFFGTGLRVLRGGSWATRPTIARPTFRNWDLPQRRQLFAGFRCARDV